MPWWLIILLSGLLGWIWSHVAVSSYYEHLDTLLAQAGGVEHAPKDLVDRWQVDGAKRSFAVLFGWLYELIYLVPWLVVYAILNALRAARHNADVNCHES